ncbi:MAG: hypothetical protein NT175_10200 [Bacteroidetes bacterium]|nr:hypothetical protein [Bacteroidota bacterium]
MNLSTFLFWDVDYNTIDWDRHSEFVISRVLSRGSLEDFKEIKTYYGFEKIKQAVLHLRYLDKRTLNFCCFYFSIPKEQFRCYNIIPSSQKHWIY